MERSMEIKVVSARDLNNVNLLTRMGVYTVVKLVAADNAKPKSDQKFKTPVDKEGGSNPIWNFSHKFAVDEAAARANRLTLVFKLCSQRNLGDREIGEVYVPVMELLDSVGEGKGDLMQHLSYQVRKPSGNPQGVLNFAFKFSDDVPSGLVKPEPVHSDNPVSAYPASEPPEPSSLAVAHGGSHPPPLPPQPEAYSPASNLYSTLPPKMASQEIGYNSYPPLPAVAAGYSVYSPAPSFSSYAPAPFYSSYAPEPFQPGYGYNHHPPLSSTSVYGYPPPTAYAYPPGPSYYPPQLQKKKSNMGLGLGAGLVGGMLGGLLIGDMVSDAADGVFDF